MSIEIQNVSKFYGDNQALKKISLCFQENKIYGLLGRNGAGKSTLLNIISNRIFKSAGKISIDGMRAEENNAALEKIYMMSEKNYYPIEMKVKEAFFWTKRFYPSFDTEYAYRTAKKFGLDTSKKIKELSTGFSSIFKLVICLSVGTPYLFLDEPVLGLDAGNRELFYRLLLDKYAEQPCTVVISTHLIEEISSIIEEVIIIKNGEILKNESREALLSQGYSVSGKISEVNAYTAGRNVIGEDTLGGLKTAYILGTPEIQPHSSLDFSALDLQKLFVQLTNA